MPDPAPPPAPDGLDALLAAGGVIAAEYAPPDPPPAAGPDAGPPPPAAPPPPARCPHCGDDLAAEAEPVTDAEKFDWAAAVLARRPYARREPLWGGRVHLTLRRLTAAEADAVSGQLALDERAGRLANGYAVMERLERLRLAVQLVRVEGDPAHPFPALPDGLSPQASPQARTVWPPAMADDAAAAGTTLLDRVERYVREEVLGGEDLYAAAQLALRAFNRRVGRLVAAARDPDFFASPR